MDTAQTRMTDQDLDHVRIRRVSGTIGLEIMEQQACPELDLLNLSSFSRSVREPCGSSYRWPVASDKRPMTIF